MAHGNNINHETHRVEIFMTMNSIDSEFPRFCELTDRLLSGLSTDGDTITGLTIYTNEIELEQSIFEATGYFVDVEIS